MFYHHIRGRNGFDGGETCLGSESKGLGPALKNWEININANENNYALAA